MPTASVTITGIYGHDAGIFKFTPGHDDRNPWSRSPESAVTMKRNTHLNLKMERIWQKDYANHLEASNDIADYIVGRHEGAGGRGSQAGVRLSKCPRVSQFSRLAASVSVWSQ